jgi:hypothetical protein
MNSISFFWRTALMAVTATCLSSVAYAGVVFDGSPGSGAPPSTLGGYAMTAFSDDPRDQYSTVSDGRTGPTGNVGFDHDMTLLTAGNGWNNWSNSYTGDVYFTGFGSNSVTMMLPTGTDAFYFYAEVNLFTTAEITATTDDGTTSGPISVTTPYGAKYFGFYGTGGTKIVSITVSYPNDGYGFAVGEFGISTCSGPTIAVSVNPTSVWPPNHNMANVAASVSTTGSCTPLTVQLVSVTSNEADNGDDDGDTWNDVQGVSAGTADYAFSVRKERSGSGSGRVYTATYRVTDASGNTATASATIRCPLNQSSKLVYNAAGQGVSLVSMEQNAPNPFSSWTRLGFKLAESQVVTMKVYDNRGVEVATLANGSFDAGTHYITWDGKSNDGTAVVSGQYMCRIEAGGVVDTKVMTIVR